MSRVYVGIVCGTIIGYQVINKAEFFFVRLNGDVKVCALK
jgi:hypothetical protein